MIKIVDQKRLNYRKIIHQQFVYRYLKTFAGRDTW